MAALLDWVSWECHWVAALHYPHKFSFYNFTFYRFRLEKSHKWKFCFRLGKVSILHRFEQSVQMLKRNKRIEKYLCFIGKTGSWGKSTKKSRFLLASFFLQRLYTTIMYSLYPLYTQHFLVPPEKWSHSHWNIYIYV